MGQVCRKHEEFYEEACRWCESTKAVEGPALPIVPISAQWGGNLNAQAAAQQNVASSVAMTQNGHCACRKFFLGPPFRYFDGVMHHTQARCAVVFP